MTALQLGLRQLRRDWRAGELTVLVLALIIAVASVSSVNFFSNRIQLALESQSNDLLGGDMVLSSNNPVAAARVTAAVEAGLKTAKTVEFPTMVLADGLSQLVALKAVSSAYPLRGQVHIASELFAPATAVGEAPAVGSVWAGSQVLTQLGIEVGDSLSVGAVDLVVAAVLINEPEQSGGMLFGFAPRLLMNINDLPATQLVQPASRVNYRLLLAGETDSVAKLQRDWQNGLAAGERLSTIKDARPQVETALERAEAFLGLAALVSVLLAAAAVAMAARRFVSRHLDSCAVMRCLGAEQRFISRLYLWQMIVLGLLASSLGVLLGYWAQWGLVALLGPLADIELPPPGAWPVALGYLTGMITLLGFAIPPILQLANVPTLRVLNRDLGGVGLNTATAYVVGIIAFVVLTFLQAQSIKLAATIIFGLLLLLLILVLLSAMLLQLLKRFVGHGGASWHFGLVNISRRARQSIIQMVGFSIGLMALLLLAVVRTDLLDEWQGRIADNTPNRFLINIQSSQLDQVRTFFDAENIDVPVLYPMVRARLVEINGQAVVVDDFISERGKRLASREFNLSWAAEMQQDNQIVAGRWWGEAEHGKALLSVEAGLAKELGLGLGDSLTYSAAGQRLTAEISSLRSVNWDSFNANFFVLAPPQLLGEFPVSYITAFYLSEAEHAVLNRLLQQFPNITVFDVAGILAQVRAIIERVSLAVEYVFLFTLLAGLMVMFAAIHATLDERIREAAILRTLGARRGQLLSSIMLEYAGLGLLSGLVAASVAGVVGMVVAGRIFDLEYVPGLTLWLAGSLVGAVGVGLAGTLGTRFVINQPPLKTLRQY